MRAAEENRASETAAENEGRRASSSAFGPLRFPVFRALWIATVVSNVGTWMHDVGAGWLMTSLSQSPLLVALVQTATTLPMFLLALPAGAMADIVDRRRMLLAAQLLGPALGGVIVAFAGPPAVFALNAVSYLAVLFVLFTWKREATAQALPPEHFLGALKAGYRYSRHSPAMRVVLIRAAGFFLFGSALWAMLPLVARRELGLEAAGYGVLLGCMGAGAVLGAVLLKRLRPHMSANAISVVATAGYAAAMLALALSPNAVIAGIVMFVAGLSWIGMLTTLVVAAQLASPGWVKARALSVYLLVFQGAMTGGSILWGSLASSFSVSAALSLAALGQLAGLALALRWQLPDETAADLSPSNHWAEPVVAVQPSGDRGPVLIEIEYRVEPARIAEFVSALRRFRSQRQRDGAIRWDVWEDVAEPGRVTEQFVVESWIEHQRQHARVTHADQIEQDVVLAFHLGSDGPVIRHLLRPL